MASDKLVHRLAIAVLAPAFGQRVFLLRFQYREPPDLFEISCEAGFGCKDRQGRGAGHDQKKSRLVSKQNYRPSERACPLDFETLLSFEEAIVSARETAELLLLLGRLVQAEGYQGDLNPAQWMALRFFARANAFSRTPSAFAEFQATTRGTASQAIKALEAGGYVVRRRSQADGRSVSLHLTKKGHKALARDPFEVLVRAVDSLDWEEQTAVHDALHHVLTTVAASSAHRHFGVCQDCAHLGGANSCGIPSATPSTPECLLFGVPIEPEDTGLLCVHFEPKRERREGGHHE
jgi:DNA-binding MarR family transcriptional regulator